MQVSTLERMEIPASALVIPQNDFPEQTLQALGYSKLWEEKGDRSLLRTLVSLGVIPFSRESVDSYMQAVVIEGNPQAPRYKRLVLIGQTIAGALSAIFIGPAILGWIVSANTGLAMVMAFMICLIALLAFSNATDKDWITREWRSSRLHNYTLPVPENALAMAVRIKEKFSQADFRVYSFEKKLDPFLAVDYGQEEYFLAVWDEPKFDAAATFI